MEISINEINKGNEIIKKLQSDHKTQKQKTKNKTLILVQQEEYIKQKDLQIEEFKKLIQEKERNINNKEREVDNNNTKILE